MISPHDTQQVGCAAEGFAIVADANQQAAREAAIQRVATWRGWQEDGNGGGFELFNLRVALGKHPAGSTVSRATLEKLLFGNYGSASVFGGGAKDFDAIEI